MACSSLTEFEVLGLSRIVFVAMALAMTAAGARTWRSPSHSNSLCRKDFSELSVQRFCSSGLRKWSGAAVVCAAGKKNPGPKPRSGAQARRKPKVQRIVDNDDEDVEKALEALFAQLEMDLIEEGDDGGDDEEFTDEELAQMTKELEAAYIDMDREDDDDEDEDKDAVSSGLVDMVMTDGVYSQGKAQAREDEDEDEDFEDDDDEQRMVPLDKWQLLKLAAAVEKGRRNVNVSLKVSRREAFLPSKLTNVGPSLISPKWVNFAVQIFKEIVHMTAEIHKVQLVPVGALGFDSLIALCIWSKV